MHKGISQRRQRTDHITATTCKSWARERAATGAHFSLSSPSDLSLRLDFPPGDGPVGDAAFLTLELGGVLAVGLPMHSDCDRPRFAGAAATATLAGAAGVVSATYGRG